MARRTRYCRNGDGNKHYAKGYCQACYMRVYRNGEAPTPEDEMLEDIDPPLLDTEELSEAMTTRMPTLILATEDREEDTDGIREMRRKLAAQTYLARREIVRGMLYDGYEPWQVKNEFLSRPELFNQFLKPLKSPDRTLDEDMAVVANSGRLKPLERYIDGLKRSLRRANTFAENQNLTAKERSVWAKSADELLRNLGLIEGAIHAVPGRGDVPLGDDGYEVEGSDDSSNSGRPKYSLPNVEAEDED